jgi:hypothetical protein
MGAEWIYLAGAFFMIPDKVITAVGWGVGTAAVVLGGTAVALAAKDAAEFRRQEAEAESRCYRDSVREYEARGYKRLEGGYWVRP